MQIRQPILCLAMSALISCGQTPTFDGAFAPVDRDAPYPDLIPLAQLAIAALRTRAGQLAGPVVDTATRAEMRAATRRAALR